MDCCSECTVAKKFTGLDSLDQRVKDTQCFATYLRLHKVATFAFVQNYPEVLMHGGKKRQSTSKDGSGVLGGGRLC